MKTAPPPAKITPYSKDAEQSVLGAIMLDNRALDRVIGIVQSSDFYLPANRLIFEAIQQLADRQQPLDVLTVTEVIRSQGAIEKVGGESYLYEIAHRTPSAANVEAYANIVREQSVLRQLVQTSTDIIERVYAQDGTDVKELLDQAEQGVFRIAESHDRGEGPVDIASLVAKAVERIDTLYHQESDITGVTTGFSDLDDMTSGLQAGDLVIVAGRPSMGKTTFAMNMAENIAMQLKENTKPVLVFSMEMPAESLALRMMSSLGRIDQHAIRTGKLADEDWPRVTSAVNILSEASLYIDDTPALSPAEVRSRARRLAREHGGVSLILLDYMQLMRVPGYKDNRVGEVSEISRSLKALAKELNVPVVALSQLNRSLEQRHDKRPVMSDLRESGSIEQDADLIMFIYRDEVYNPETPDKGTAEVIIGKHRNGPIGKVRLTFLGQYTRFENFLPQTATMDSPF